MRLSLESLETRRLLASGVDTHELLSSQHMESGTLDRVAEVADTQSADQDRSVTAGDANRDGRFDYVDIVQVLQSGKYETGRPASWAEGDWNDDGLFDHQDILIAFQQSQIINATQSAHVSGKGDDRQDDDPLDHEDPNDDNGGRDRNRDDDQLGDDRQDDDPLDHEDPNDDNGGRDRNHDDDQLGDDRQDDDPLDHEDPNDDNGGRDRNRDDDPLGDDRQDDDPLDHEDPNDDNGGRDRNRQEDR